MTRLVTADATRVSPSQFLDAVLGTEPKSPEQKARELAEWQEQTRRECAEYRAGMEARYAALPRVSDVLGEQLTEVNGDPFGDAFQARAATPSGLSQSALASCQHRIAIARKSA